VAQAEREEKFLRALSDWDESMGALNSAAERYRVQHASTYLSATGADALRKAAADAATSELRKERDHREREERLNYHRMIFYRGSAGEVERAS
jgi:oxalate decarboxylase/phosphoglucose isomerase-like protein (cupin superfamily)